MSGAADDWAYEHLGVYSWTTEFWDVIGAATGTPASTDSWELGPTDEQALAVLRWADEHAPGQFVDWYPFEHPQLGPVELGGWPYLGLWTNPPSDLLKAEVDAARRVRRQPGDGLAAAGDPPPARPSTSAAARGGSRSASPTAGGCRPRSRCGRPATTSCARSSPRSAGEGVTVVGGPARLQLGQLGGHGTMRFTYGRDGTPDRRLVTWVVQAPAGHRGHRDRPPRPRRTRRDPPRPRHRLSRRSRSGSRSPVRPGSGPRRGQTAIHDFPDRVLQEWRLRSSPVPSVASSTAQLEDEAITIIREIAAECERPVLLFSGGKDSVVMLHLAHRAFWPARIPFPVMHIDTGHNFDEVIEFRDRAVAEFDVELVVASVQHVDRRRPRPRGHQPPRHAQPAADRHAARRHHRAPLRRRVRRRPPRRGAGPGQGARRVAPRRVRPVGPEEPAARAVGDLQHPPPPRRAPPGVPAVELDRARHLALHRRAQGRPAAAVPRPPPPGVPPRRDADGRQPPRRPR